MVHRSFLEVLSAGEFFDVEGTIVSRQGKQNSFVLTYSKFSLNPLYVRVWRDVRYTEKQDLKSV
jgi:hypothetical protein